MWCRITEEAPGMEKRQATFYDLKKAREYFLELVKAAWPGVVDTKIPDVLSNLVSRISISAGEII